jgi:hypothetical protein
MSYTWCLPNELHEVSSYWWHTTLALNRCMCAFTLVRLLYNGLNLVVAAVAIGHCFHHQDACECIKVQ